MFFRNLLPVSRGNEGDLPGASPSLPLSFPGTAAHRPLPPDRDAVVGALMPAGMIAPECPSFSSSAPPSETSATASPVSTEACLLAADAEDRPSPGAWPEKRGEVSEAK